MIKSLNPAFDQVCGSIVTELMNRDDITEIYINDDGYVVMILLVKAK